MWIVGAQTLIAGCALDAPKIGKTSDEPLVLTASTKLSIEGTLDYGTVVFAENPTTLLEAGDFHGYEFDGKAGGVVTITMTSSVCGLPDTFLALFGPEDANGNRGTSLFANDDALLAPCDIDSQILSFRLPVDGGYLITATTFDQAGGGHYRLEMTCDNNACALPGSPTFESTRIAQADIDNGAFTPQDLFEIGDFMFDTVYRVEDGMGNALNGAPAGNSPRPNFREIPNNVHFAAFGAPEAQTCVTCHNVGGDNGAGDLNHNIFQIGDGFNRNTGLQRNPPTVLGDGFRQQIGIEMTAELQGELAAAKATAATTNVAVNQALTSKGISFGSVIANADGTVDTAGVVGVDADLVIKPFGWKGREATIRRFIEGGFRVHFGLQAQPSIDKNCANPNVNTFGNGPDCQDPDGDGVAGEISEGQLTAQAVYMGLREVPIRVPAATSALQQRAVAGEALFNSATIGCATCHAATMKLNNPLHVELPDTTGGAGITLNLATDSHEPRPAVNADGSMSVVLWSDFKRHDMGAGLADSKPFGLIGVSQFISPPLWGVATSAPYLHDGRAATLNDAILLHGGEAQAARDAYAALAADDQAKLQEFLGTLGRAENIVPVTLGGFVVTQTRSTNSIKFTVPAGTQVPHGGFLIVAHNATKAAFEAFYGKTLDPTHVVFINSAALGTTQFPQISGSEKYTLANSALTTIDGPTIQEPSGGRRTFQRTNCGAPAGVSSSWISSASSATTASPGAGIASTGQNRVCISEIADGPTGTTTGFEYIEVFAE